MRIQSCISILAVAFGLSVASEANALEVSNGLSTNGLSTNGQDAKGAVALGMKLEAAILQDGSVILLGQ